MREELNPVYKEALYFGGLALAKRLPDRSEDLDPWEYGHSFGYRIMDNEGNILAEDKYYDARYCALESFIIYENMIIVSICDTGD